MTRSPRRAAALAAFLLRLGIAAVAVAQPATPPQPFAPDWAMLAGGQRFGQKDDRNDTAHIVALTLGYQFK